MNMLSTLSSSLVKKGNAANHKVPAICVINPDILKEIAEGLKNKEVKIVADCCEVFTEVAKLKSGIKCDFKPNYKT